MTSSGGSSARVGVSPPDRKSFVKKTLCDLELSDQKFHDLKWPKSSWRREPCEEVPTAYDDYYDHSLRPLTECPLGRLESWGRCVASRGCQASRDLAKIPTSSLGAVLTCPFSHERMGLLVGHVKSGGSYWGESLSRWGGSRPIYIYPLPGGAVVWEPEPSTSQLTSSPRLYYVAYVGHLIYADCRSCWGVHEVTGVL